MKVMLDTCALSEIRRSGGSLRVKEAVADIPDGNLYVSAITIGEIHKGIALLKDEPQKARLQKWISTLETSYAGRILPVRLDTVRIWGELTAKAQKRGKIIGASDGLIAATAIEHGLHVMTRNTRDFEPTGAMLLNPWDC